MVALPRYSPWRADGPLIPRFTDIGGLAVPMINATGAASVKGSTVHVSSVVSRGVSLTDQGVPDCIGAVYDGGIPDGGVVRVIVAGVAEVLFVSAATRGFLARTFVATDADAQPGKAKSEAVPSSPFATDKHFSEIGHIIESTTGAGLAMVVLHFN